MSDQQNYSSVVSTAREYYNSDDADNFYYHVWGGEDIHVGLYEHDGEPIGDASKRTVEQMASKVADKLGFSARVLDIGAGYGGAARYLARHHGCHVTCLNLSEVENQRNRQMNDEQAVADKIDVVDGSFEKLPFDDASFDVVWSQDAILHSGERKTVLAEVARVLKPGGKFVFTDPMMADDCPEGVLQPILDRIHLATLGSPGFYLQAAKDVGLRVDGESDGGQALGFEDITHQLPRHYGRVLEQTKAEESLGSLEGKVSAEYIERMKKGLQHWVDGGHAGHLAWGVFLFQKPEGA